MGGAQHSRIQSNDSEQNRQIPCINTKPVFIPGDIWGCIAQFMSREDLCRLMGVNSTLFHHAMEAKYRSVSFQHFDDATMQKLRRLRDPAVAPRVRILHVNPYYVQGQLDLYSNKNPRNETTYKASAHDIIQAMINTVSALSNVTEFSVDWSLSLDQDLSPEHLRPFFTAAWKTFGSGLYRIVLSVGLENYPSLLPSAGMLPTLQELELQLPRLPSNDKNNVLVTAVAPFINRVAPTLRILLLSSSFSMFKRPSIFNYSSLFHSVRTIPNLEQLDVRMDFYMCGLSDPHGMTRILRDHATTLRHVKWTQIFNTSGDSEAEFSPWMEKNKHDRVILSNLLTLEFSIPPSAKGFDLAAGYINRSADTLVSLSLFGSYLSHDEVKAVLSIFRHRRTEQSLEELLLCVKLLSPELVLMVARMLPSLHKLTLHIESVAEALLEWEEPKCEAGEITKPPDFPDELRNRDIQSWNLYDFDLIGSRLINSGFDTDKLMYLFTECVPSIKRVSGKDKVSFKAARLRPLCEDIMQPDHAG